MYKYWQTFYYDENFSAHLQKDDIFSIGGESYIKTNNMFVSLKTGHEYSPALVDLWARGRIIHVERKYN